MNENRANFKNWYVDILAGLYPNREAGFVILLVTFPLLERYLREKSGIHEQLNLDPRFYQKLLDLFPELETIDEPPKFWEAYRHGLLHQVTIGHKRRKSGVSHDLESTLKTDSSGKFWLHPVKFAKRVIQQIEDDFSTFEGGDSGNPPLPRIYSHGGSGFSGTATSGPEMPSFLVED